MVTVTPCEVLWITMESDLDPTGNNAAQEFDYTIF
jgi:hypothetical protein